MQTNKQINSTANGIRHKRPLDTKGAPMKQYWHKTDDNIVLRLTRFCNENWKHTKGPILCIPGLSANRAAFMSDLMRQNLIEMLCAHQFDTWIMDTRSSIDMKAHQKYTLDEMIQFDYKSAILKILQITQSKDIIVLCHCLGSLTFISSLLGGMRLLCFFVFTVSLCFC